MKNKLIKIGLMCMTLGSMAAYAVPSLYLNFTESNKHVDSKVMNYYKVKGFAGDVIESKISNLSADADLYVKIGSEPTTSSKDCKSTNGSTTVDSCSVTLSEDANVYVGVYGYKEADYAVKATLKDSKVKTIGYNQDVFGITPRLKHRDYKIHANAGDVLKIRAYGMDADGDLYVKLGSKARRGSGNNLASSHQNGLVDEEVTIEIDNDTDVYIGLYADKSCIHTVEHHIKVTRTNAVEEITVLNSGEADSGSVALNKLKHYKIHALAGDTVKGILNGLDADADLFMQVGKKSGNHAFDCKSQNGGTKTDSCEVTLKKDADVYIAIHGYRAADFTIRADVNKKNKIQKKLILHQKGHWLPCMAGNMASRAAYINTLPFSGFTMVGNSYTNRVMEPNAPLLSYAYIWDEVKSVKNLYPNKSNFLVVNMHYPADFWNDSVWNNVIANFRTLAKVAKNLGFKGIIYDDEAYDVESYKMINYDKEEGAWYDERAYKNPNYTFSEHVNKITARFKQIMEAMVIEYPTIDVLYYHSPVEGHIKANHGIDGHPVVVHVSLERSHEMVGAMFLGLKQGMSSESTLHDMGEDYRLRTQKHFDDAYTWRKHTIASDATNNAVDAMQHWIVPQSDRATWAQKVHVDFMVSNEPLSSSVYPEFDTTNSVGINDMKTTLERALDKSDKYVVFYSASSSDNKGGRIQLDWMNDPATHADNGSSYGVNEDWKNMVQGVYDSIKN